MCFFVVFQASSLPQRTSSFSCIWLACTSNCPANSGRVLSPLYGRQSYFGLEPGGMIMTLSFHVSSPPGFTHHVSDLRSCLEIRIVEAVPRLWLPQGAMGAKIRIVVDYTTPKHHNEPRPRRNAAGRNSGAAAVDDEFPNSFLVT